MPCNKSSLVLMEKVLDMQELLVMGLLDMQELMEDLLDMMEQLTME